MKIANQPISPRPGKGETPVKSDDLALRGLAFLAADEERVARFLDLTGLDPGDLRALVGDSAFHLAILDHFAADEPLLLAFARSEGLPPEAVGQARRALGALDD